MLFWVAVLLLLSPVAAVQLTVELENQGSYSGVALRNGVTQWLGMRYAAPPKRFEPPQPPLPFIGVHAANKHGSLCMHVLGNYNVGNQSDPGIRGSEDCLFADIYAPSNATARSNLPVFVFIQGGGFAALANANMNGTGLVMASGLSILVVTFNYRVGPWGFLAAGNSIKANNGLRDQRQLLAWVRQHIARFGGNPKHIVIGGDSAGAASAALQMTAFGGRDDGLFVGVAAESISRAYMLTVPQAKYQFDNLAARTGCVTDQLACLLRASAAEIQAASAPIPYPSLNSRNASAPLFMWSPVIDGDFITNRTYAAFQSGAFVRVPMIAGADTNDGTYFAPRSAASQEDSDDFLRGNFPRLADFQLDRLAMLYPNEDTSCPRAGCFWHQTADVYGQMRYMCSGLYVSRQVGIANNARSWVYRWNVEDAAQMAMGVGVPHAVELAALFAPENLYPSGNLPPSYYVGGRNRRAVDVIRGYWVSFIKTLDPNPARMRGTAEWRSFGDQSSRLVVNTGGNVVMENLDDKLKARCEYIWQIAGIQDKFARAVMGSEERDEVCP